MIPYFWRRIPESYDVCRLTNEISYDSVILAKDNGVIRGLLIDGALWKAEKTELTNNCMLPENQ